MHTDMALAFFDIFTDTCTGILTDIPPDVHLTYWHTHVLTNACWNISETLTDRDTDMLSCKLSDMCFETCNGAPVMANAYI
jgi:hypothetical protein